MSGKKKKKEKENQSQWGLNLNWDIKSQAIQSLSFSILVKSENEPQHDKTNKMACAPSEDSDQSAPTWSAQSDHSLRYLH